MAQININVKLDENLKKQVEYCLDEMGLNLSSAITIFFKTIVREQKIPFEIAMNSNDNDGFYNAYNLKIIKDSLNDNKPGIVKTMEELRALENE